MSGADLTDLLLALVLASQAWVLKEVYSFNARASKNEAAISDHEHRISLMEGTIAERAATVARAEAHQEDAERRLTKLENA